MTGFYMKWNTRLKWVNMKVEGKINYKKMNVQLAACVTSCRLFKKNAGHAVIKQGNETSLDLLLACL